MKTIPRPYQLRGVKKIERFNGRVLLADDMGLGKSYQSLLWWKKHNGSKPVVIICPCSVKYNWKHEAQIHIHTTAVVLEGSKTRKLPKAPIYILNYDILKYWLPVLLELDPQVIIIDECHNIKNRSAKRTKLIKQLCKGRPHVLALSGTPITNRPSEIWTTLNLLLPKEYPSFLTFAFRYARPRRTPWGWQFNGAKNLPELHANLKAQCMIRRRKADVLKDLPPKTRCVVPLKLNKRREYDLAYQDFKLWIRRNYIGKSHGALHAEALVKGGYLKRLVAELKLVQIMDWLDEFLEDSDGKIILFAIHKKIIKAFRTKYPGISVVIDGSVTGLHRQHAIDQFQGSKKIRMLIGNIRAAGTGWNGTAASAIAFAELGWTPGEHSQAEDRGHRIGQVNPLSCYYFIAQNTIEEKLCKLIQDKQGVLDAALDGQEQVEASIDIFDQLMQVIGAEK